MSYLPPYALDETIVSLIAEISEQVGRLTVTAEHELRLRRVNRIRTLRGSLAIEGNTLSEEQITAILGGRPVIAPKREVQEVRNAAAAYDRLDEWQPTSERDLLAAHEVMMRGLVNDAGRYRIGGVGVMQGDEVLHMAPPADRVPALMTDLLAWLADTPTHPLIASALFHYEFEFIHPFSDGNGRLGRLWQTLILSRWQPVLADLPVESLVHAHQEGYYQAIALSTARTNAAPFITFMLTRILETCRGSTPEVTRDATPEVRRLLAVLQGEMSRKALMRALQLRDAEHFRRHYLKPSLEGGWVEMTQPQSPRSPTQRYRLTPRASAWIEENKE